MIGDLGFDWIMGEEVVDGELVPRYARDARKGYLNWSVKDDQAFEEVEFGTRNGKRGSQAGTTARVEI